MGKRINTVLIHHLTAPRDAGKLTSGTERYWSVRDVNVFEGLHNRAVMNSIALSDSFTKNSQNVLRHAFDAQVKYFKSMIDDSIEPFIRHDSKMVIFNEWIWGLDLNTYIHLMKGILPAQKESYWMDLAIDPAYTGVGLLYDVAFVMKADVSKLGPMNVEDATVYIARWGGQPGLERNRTPYGITK